MAKKPFKGMLSPLVKLLDRSGAASHHAPTPEQDTTRFPGLPWDLRTIIIVFGPGAPFRFLNLNVLLGLTGVPFDRVDQLHGIGPMDAFDLQFCLEGNDRSATCKKYFSIAKDLEYEPDKVEFRLGDRLEFRGSWPEYSIRYRQPEEDLSLSMRLASQDDFQWWSYAPGMYCHYTSFCDCELEWSWKGQGGSSSVIALHDHGWGRNLLPVRLPVRVFRYEVMRIEERGTAISLWTEAPPGLTLKNVGLVRRENRTPVFMPRYHCEVLEWDEFSSYAGRACRVPRRWVGTQEARGARFRYEAARATEPRPVIGNGFMYGFDYQGELSGPEGAARLEGRGYVEQLGLLVR